MEAETCGIEEYRDAIQMCRDGICKELELKLTKDAKNSVSTGTLYLLISQVGQLVTTDMESAELNNFLPQSSLVILLPTSAYSLNLKTGTGGMSSFHHKRGLGLRLPEEPEHTKVHQT